MANEALISNSLSTLEPELIIILGDIFDEGQWSPNDAFNRDFERFVSMFDHNPKKSRLIAVVGNHDVGFHHRMHPYVVDRFNTYFNHTSSVNWHVIKDSIHFVTINSMALYGDSCHFCADAEQRIDRLTDAMRCLVRNERSNQKNDQCHNYYKSQQALSDSFSQGLLRYSRPILLMHFPLFRHSDEHCDEPDAMNAPEKNRFFEVNHDCLSKGASEYVLEALQPRVAFTGHTHHGCITKHKYNIQTGSTLYQLIQNQGKGTEVPKEDTITEFTVSSFNWRNKVNPAFLLAIFTPDNYAVSKCQLPNEITVFSTYATSIILIVIYIIYSVFHPHMKRISTITPKTLNGHINGSQHSDKLHDS